MEAAVGGQLLKAVEEASLEEVSFDDLDFDAGAGKVAARNRGEVMGGAPKKITKIATDHHNSLKNVFRDAINIPKILDGLRSSHDFEKTQTTGTGIRRVKSTHLDQLDHLAGRQFRATQAPTISVSGRSLPLVYKVISTLVSPPQSMALFVLDLDGRFDATRLTCTDDDLQHVYVQQPPYDANSGTNVELIRSLIADAERFMVYKGSSAASLSREFWGTIVLGGLGAGDLVAGWKGWLNVERDHVAEYSMRVTMAEAFERRSDRQAVVDGAGWAAASPWGRFTFDD